MQLALPPFATAGVVVVAAGLICVTPVAAPHLERRAVDLATFETLTDPSGPTDAVVDSLGGLGGELSGVPTNLADFSGTSADVASSLADPATVDLSYYELLLQQYADNPFVEQILVLGLIFFVGPLDYVEALFTEIYDEIVSAFGGAVAPAATETLDAGAMTAAADLLGPSALSSVLDLNPIADVAAVVDPAAIADIAPAFDPAALADIGTVLGASTIPDLGDILTSLIP
jgi:hypothetical protein